MADLTDTDIKEAYLDVRSNSETTWLLLDYESKSDKLKLTKTGSGGLSDFEKCLEDSNASYGYARVTYSSDDESKREKFILVIWIGKDCKPMRRGKVSVHSADVKEVLRVYSIEVAAKEKGDLNEESIIERLKKAGGANYDGQKQTDMVNGV